MVKEAKGVNSAVVLEKKGVPYIQTMGINFEILSNYPIFDKKAVRSNDIQAIAKKYGVHFT